MKKIFFILFFLILTTKVLFSHSVECEIIEGGIGVEVRYEDVEKTPISYAEVKVYSPDGKEFQQGLTDKFGRFVFYPTQKGVYKIEVNDGMGHGVVKEINVSKEKEIVKTSDIVSFSLWQKIVMGVCIIWGIVGIIFYFVSKKHFKR